MLATSEHHRPFGNTGLRVPPIAFAACALAGRRRVIPDQTKLELCGEWFRHVAPPVLIEHTVNSRNQVALDVLARTLRRLDIRSEELIVILKFPCEHNENDYREVIKLAPSGCRLLAAIEIPDDYLTAATSTADRQQRLGPLIKCYRALEDLKGVHPIAAIGVAGSDWRVLQELHREVPLDWIGLDGGFTVMRHPPELLSFMTSLADRAIPIVVSRVFAAGFLVGGSYYENRTLHDDNPQDRQLLAWRKAFVALCHGHGITPAHACVQFALAGPGVAAVVVDTTHVDRIAENVSAAITKVPAALWESMREEGLLAVDYPLVE